MAPWLFLVVSLVGLALSVSTLVRARYLWFLSVPYFFGAWLAGELALHHLVWQAVATLGFAAVGALAAWPGILGLGLTFVSWACLFAAHSRAVASAPSLRRAIAEYDLEIDPHVSLRDLVRPFRMRRPGTERIANVAYGESLPGDRGRRNLLDVILPIDPGEKRPILLQIHGGGWVIGEKEQQGQPLMYHMAQRGWVCFAPNYRLSPQATFPDQIVDVKRSIAWLRDHAEEYGADPDFICISGGSAGGHLAALAGLSAGDPGWQPGFEAVDTSLAACVPLYGIYDFLDRRNIRGSQRMEPFLASQVLKCTPQQNPELWENASPIARVHEAAPPFLVIHGSHDSLAFVEEARVFVEALKEKSRSPVLYLEFEGGQHAFDVFHSVRSVHAIRAVAAFLEKVHRDHAGSVD
jgi:acetyl esterase/lipase